MRIPKKKRKKKHWGLEGANGKKSCVYKHETSLFMLFIHVVKVCFCDYNQHDVET